ncbi:MAG: nucleoside recognition domain-containing protein [Candidatus Limivivens sp.]|nr:nucleoside recognition domain-containing protein [Candidatus Limivivens sp.]
MNYLWGAMLLIGIVYGAFTGRMQEVTDAVLNSSKEAVTLCITMTGVMALWVGIMEIAKESGLMERLAAGMRPLVRFLFPRIPEEHPALESITANFLANFLGLGWGATPAGLKTMESLAELEEERRAEEDRRIKGERNLGELRKKDAGNANQTAKTGRSRRISGCPAMPRSVASNEMCTFLILNISSLQLIPVNIIAYRSQYGSVNPTAIVGPAIVATAVSTGVAVIFCKIMDRKRRV